MTDESHTRQETRGPVPGGVSGTPISWVGCGSAGRYCPLGGSALPCRGAKARLAAMSRAARITAQRQGRFIADSFGVPPPCASGAATALGVTPEKARRPRADGKGPSAQGRGEVSVRNEGGAAMRIPIQTAGRCDDTETRTPARDRQHRSRPRPGSLPGAGPHGPTRHAHPSKRPARAGLASPFVSPQRCRTSPTSPPAS